MNSDLRNARAGLEQPAPTSTATPTSEPVFDVAARASLAALIFLAGAVAGMLYVITTTPTH